MALEPTWTEPVELSTNDVLTATAMNQQVYQNILYLREPYELKIATMTANQNIENQQEWANITDLLISIVCPLGKALVTVNLPYLYREDTNDARYVRFGLVLNEDTATRKIIHTNSSREATDGVWGTVSSTVFLTGLETDTATAFRIQVYNDSATGSSSDILTVYGGNPYLSQLAVQAIG
jgi:hypothetical protein